MIDIMNHYTYCIIFPTIPRLYIGVRSYNGPPSQDDYRSSSSKVKRLIKDGFPYTLTVIGTFETRRQAEDNEITLHALFDVAKNPYFLNGARAVAGGFSRAGVESEQRGRTYEEMFGHEEAERRKSLVSQKLKGRVFTNKSKKKMSASHADVTGDMNPRAVGGQLMMGDEVLLEYSTKHQLVTWCMSNGVPHRPILKLKSGDEYRPNLTSRNVKFKKWFGLRVLECQKQRA